MPPAPSTPQLACLRIGDTPSAWSRAGFTVDGGGCADVGGITLELTGDRARRGVLTWSFRHAGDIDPLIREGLPTIHADDAPDRAGRDEDDGSPHHPNGVVAVDHVVVTTPDTGRTTAAFAAAGLEPRRVRPFTLDGKPMVQVFYVAGGAAIEQVGPPEDRLGPDRDGPAAFWGLGFTTADLDAATELLDDRLSPARAAVQPGRRIATLRHARVGISVPIVLLSPRPPRGERGSEVS